MKRVVLFILVGLFIIGCSKNVSVPKFVLKLPATSVKIAKENLLKKADSGDIKAIILLHEHYSFPETKEGFEYYKRYYPIVLKSDNAKDILTFAKIYKHYKEMFINGDQKYIALLM